MIYIHKDYRDDLLSGLEHYYNANDFNQTFYYSDSTKTEEQINTILRDADKLLTLCSPDYNDTTEYQILLVANLEESVGKNGSVITDYQLEQNIYSDSQFLQDSLQKTERQETDSIIIADGAYCGAENTGLATSKNIKLVATDLTGIDVPDIYADFELNKEGNRIIKCPAGHSPISCCCSSSNGHIHASFSKEACMNCLHKNECKIKEHKNVCSIDISATAQYRATTRRYMKTDEFKALARLRNGVETLPSLLRNKYHVDHMTVRGKIRSRFFFGCKVAALNIRKLFTFRNGLGNYAQNSLLVE